MDLCKSRELWKALGSLDQKGFLLSSWVLQSRLFFNLIFMEKNKTTNIPVYIPRFTQSKGYTEKSIVVFMQD